jgi:hypothetical protein
MEIVTMEIDDSGLPKQAEHIVLSMKSKNSTSDRRNQDSKNRTNP